MVDPSPNTWWSYINRSVRVRSRDVFNRTTVPSANRFPIGGKMTKEQPTVEREHAINHLKATSPQINEAVNHFRPTGYSMLKDLWGREWSEIYSPSVGSGHNAELLISLSWLWNL